MGNTLRLNTRATIEYVCIDGVTVKSITFTSLCALGEFIDMCMDCMMSYSVYIEPCGINNRAVD